MSVTQLFQVEDMTCGHCEKAITKALNEALPGAVVRIDLKG
ncbi:MAG: heavy-metal-associated domain-containing protein, partial [Rhizobium sp.]|nr:heavy-metal-associated domain-containing protein [Rhizobium sp.]